MRRGVKPMEESMARGEGAPLAMPLAAGGVFLVNGWVLTAADLDALGLHAG